MYKVVKSKKVFSIPNLLTEKKRLDKRYYFNQMFKRYLAGVVGGIIIGFIVGRAMSYGKSSIRIGSFNDLGQTIDVKAQEVTPKELPFCYDVIKCIRDVGEELGFSNKDILIAINISRAESGFRPDAIGVNTNKSVDRGAMQINSVHKRLSNKDAFDFEKNIRFAYQLRQEQGNWSAWSTCHNGKVNCN